MFLSGLLGYILSENDYPISPMLLAFVLSPLLEENMRKAFIISQGSVSIFFNSPIACVLMIILGVFIAFPIVKFIKKKLAKQ